MKRVICFDLWGTLVYSSVRRTYEDFLAKCWPRELIKETVRNLLMTDAWIRHPLSDHDGQGTLRPDHMRTTAMLLTRLWKISPPFMTPAHRDSCHWDMFDRNTTDFAELLFEAARYWQWENEQVRWIQGAQEVVESLKVSGETLALVTNITSYGDGIIDRVLELNRPNGRYFSVVFNSCAYPFAKPDSCVWDCLMEQFPGMNEYWMIGNDPVMDIAKPTAMGWKTILVNHPDGVPITEVPRIIKENK